MKNGAVKKNRSVKNRVVKKRGVKKISPYEASVLSYLARHNSISAAQRNDMRKDLQGEALLIAKALSSSKIRASRSQSGAVRTARGLKQWAKRLTFAATG
jgi:hypothetical protein